MSSQPGNSPIGSSVEDQADATLARESNIAGSREPFPVETSNSTAGQDSSKITANSDKEDNTLGSLDAQTRLPRENVEGLTSRNLSNRIISSGAPRQAFLTPLEENEVEAAGLDLPSLEIEVNGSLTASVRGLIDSTIEAIRNAYESRVKVEIEANWGQIVQDWLDGQENERRQAVKAELDLQYRHQWEVESRPKIAKQIEDRTEAAYQKYRDVQEKEAERRWVQEDYPSFLSEKKAEVTEKVEAELRQELEKGVVAALRAEHMNQLRDEARRQITREMMTQIRERARQDIIGDKVHYGRNMRFAKDVSARIPAETEPDIIGNGLFDVYRPDLRASSETSNFPQPTLIPNRGSIHSSRYESSDITGDPSQSNRSCLTQLPSLAPAFFGRSRIAQLSDAEATPPPPPRPKQVTTSRREPLSGINVDSGQAEHRSAFVGSLDTGFQDLPRTPEANLLPAERPFIEQLQYNLSGIRAQRVAAGLAGLDLQSNTRVDAHRDRESQAQIDQEQHFDALPYIRIAKVMPTQEAGKKRARSYEDETTDDDTDQDKENRNVTPNGPAIKRPLTSAFPVTNHRMSIRGRGAMPSAATNAARAEARASVTIVAAPLQSSATQLFQQRIDAGRDRTTRSNRLKRGREPEEAEIKEEDEISPPPAKRTRRATANSNAAHRSNSTSATTAAPRAATAVDAKQTKRKPGRPRKNRGKAAPAAARKTNLRRSNPPHGRDKTTLDVPESQSADEAVRATGDEPLDSGKEDEVSAATDNSKGKGVLRPPKLRSTSPVREVTAENRTWNSLAADRRASIAFPRPTRSSGPNDPFSSAVRGPRESSLDRADPELSARERAEGMRKGNVEIVDLESGETEENEL